MLLKEIKNIFHKELDDSHPKEEVASFFYMLIEHYLGLERFVLAIQPNLVITKEEEQPLFEALSQLRLHRPIQYIIGTSNFMDMEFLVDENVLIPRPETEELVRWVVEEVGTHESEEQGNIKERQEGTSEEAQQGDGEVGEQGHSEKAQKGDSEVAELGHCEEAQKGNGEVAGQAHSEEGQQDNRLTILDIGTGSGCIAVSLAKNLPNFEVHALDVSPKALQVARKNAQANKVDVTFVEVDILDIEDSAVRYDVIVSNPPYVREQEKQDMHKNVTHHEPELALFVSDENPLKFYEAIACFASKNLKENGSLYLEINQYLAKETEQLLRNYNFSEIELRKDMFGNFRMVKGVHLKIC